MTLNLGSRKTLRRLLTMALVVGGAACDGAIGNHGVPTGQGGNGSITGAGGNDGPTMVDPGKVTAPTTPFDAKTAFYAASKVKNLLTGMPVTDDDLTRVTTKGAAGLQELVSTWMTSDADPGRGPGQDGRLLPQHVPADGLHPDRGFQAAAAHERRLRLRRHHPHAATTRSRCSSRTCRTASR